MRTYDELLAENKALAAQFELMRLEFNDARRTLQFIAACGHDSTDKEVADAVLIESRLWISRYDDSCFKLNPQQCLAEIKAEAGRSGFIEGYEQCHHDIDNDYISRSEPMADEYAAKVRQGGAE